MVASASQAVALSIIHLKHGGVTPPRHSRSSSRRSTTKTSATTNWPVGSNHSHVLIIHI